MTTSHTKDEITRVWRNEVCSFVSVCVCMCVTATRAIGLASVLGLWGISVVYCSQTERLSYHRLWSWAERCSMFSPLKSHAHGRSHCGVGWLHCKWAEGERGVLDGVVIARGTQVDHQLVKMSVFILQHRDARWDTLQMLSVFLHSVCKNRHFSEVALLGSFVEFLIMFCVRFLKKDDKTDAWN